MCSLQNSARGNPHVRENFKGHSFGNNVPRDGHAGVSTIRSLWKSRLSLRRPFLRTKYLLPPWKLAQYQGGKRVPATINVIAMRSGGPSRSCLRSGWPIDIHLLGEPDWYRKLSGSVVACKPKLPTTNRAFVVWKSKVQFVVFFVVPAQANSV